MLTWQINFKESSSPLIMQYPVGIFPEIKGDGLYMQNLDTLYPSEIFLNVRSIKLLTKSLKKEDLKVSSLYQDITFDNICKVVYFDDEEVYCLEETSAAFLNRKNRTLQINNIDYNHSHSKKDFLDSCEIYKNNMSGYYKNYRRVA